jgi:pyridoxine/pyridoxamine 5'-phosphate oxidase
MQMPLPCYDHLDASLTEAWGRLVRGVKDRRSGFHTPVLATIGVDGAPQARTLVLRAADPATRRLRFHTDWRSRKAADLARHPRVAVLAYCAASKIQLRLSGLATHHGPQTEIARAAYARSQEKSKVCYAQALAPAAAMSAPDQAGQMEGGADNFSVIDIQIDQLEWLYLHVAGHRRAQYTWQDGALNATWLAP